MTQDENGSAVIIARCWHQGNSISETINIVRRHLGEDLTFEQIRRRFAELSAGYVSQIERGELA